MMCLAFGFSERRPCWLFFAHANKAHPSINFTYRFGTEVDFMDSSLLIRGDSISSDLYTKPTDTHQYLLPSSDHPPHVHKHLPYGLGIRLRAIVSNDTRLEHRLSELTALLTAGGYSKPAVEEQLDCVRATRRDRVLNCTKRRLGTNRTALVCTWNTRLPAFLELLRDSFPILQSNEHSRSVIDFPLVSYKCLGIYATFSSRRRQSQAGKRGRHSLAARSLVTDPAARRASVCTPSQHSLTAPIGAFRSEDTTPASLPRLSTSSSAHKRSVTQSTSERLASR